LASGYGDTLNPYASKTANYVLAAPNGSSGAPTFRAIVADDIPTLNQNTTGTASNVTGTVAVSNGGTGATSLTANNVLLGNDTSALQVVAPSTAGNVLTSNGTTWVSSASSSFPTGTVMIFKQTSAPTGWTKDTTSALNDSALRIVTGAASSGGTVAFSSAFVSQSVSGTLSSTTATNQNTTATGSIAVNASGSVTAASLSTAQLASHQHYAEGNVGPVFGTVTSSNVSRGAFNGYQTITTQPVHQSTGSGSTHTHGFTNPTYNFTGTAHTHTQDAHSHTFTGTAINLAVKYVDVIVATKD